MLELFKLLLVALSAAPRLAPGSEARLMRLAVPLLVAALAPAHGAPNAAVAGLALQMIQRLASGPSAGAALKCWSSQSETGFSGRSGLS